MTLQLLIFRHKTKHSIYTSFTKKNLCYMIKIPVPMRTLCPNLDREDGLDTVLEVPIPEEMYASNRNRGIKSWPLRPYGARGVSVFGSRAAELQFLLGVVGAPLIPLPIRSDRTVNDKINGFPIENSMAKYIVQQYIAAAGGEHALNSIKSMCAIGKVKMAAPEFLADSGLADSKAMKMKNGAWEIGGFVLWQKMPNMWSFELMVSGCKISAGSDGKVAWRQTPWQNSHASRGPPRPLRRSLQGLDPRSTANLFSNSICIGEKTVKTVDCFVLKLEAEASALKARSSDNVEIIRHTVWGYFSQKTGLLVQLEDSHLLRIKGSPQVNDDVFWETTTETLIQDYRTIDGVNIAHAGRTSVSLFRFGENSGKHTRTGMQEVWSVEEVDFNIKGLSAETFLPPADLKREEEDGGGMMYKIPANSQRVRGGRKVSNKVVAVDEEQMQICGKDVKLGN